MKNCVNCQAQFTINDSEKNFYDQLKVPEPTCCPACRMQRRFAFRNERYMYHSKCAFSGKTIISLYDPKSPYVVYDYDTWWSEQWSGLSYGKDFDFSRSFFEQFQELRQAVPRMNMSNMNSVNSLFTNHAADNKNCYMLVACEKNEDCLYGKLVQSCKNCMDCNFIYECELCYECVSCYNCYCSAWIHDCHNCSNCYFSKELRGCNDCFGCFNLRNKKHCIFNKQYAEEEYKKIMREFDRGSFRQTENMKKTVSEQFARMIVRDVHQNKCENCTGDYIEQSKNCLNCFDTTKGQDSWYLTDALEPINCMDSCFIYYKPELCLETLSTLKLYDVLYSMYIYWCSHVMYSEYCYNSQNLFGCVGLKKNEYCILNKQYAPEEYEKLKSRIIEHMGETGEFGEFFPVKFSAFGYNETVAQEYFPMTKQQILERGWIWRDEEDKAAAYQGPKYDLPDLIDEIPIDITDKILTCEKTGKLYKIIPHELAFYKKMGLPIPRECPDYRHAARMKARNPRALWPRTCAKCGDEIWTSYSPDRTETVYCEKCYLGEVY